MKSLSMTICLVAVIAISFVPSAVSGQSAHTATLPGFEKRITPFLKNYCVSCHGGTKPKAELRLDRLSAVVDDKQSAEAWQDVLDALNAGEMPPENAKQPGTIELATVIESLTNGLFEARQRFVQKPRVTMRRLNRREYEHTIRDLLGVPVQTDDFPDDGTVDGFDTGGEAHFMSEILFEKYLKAGRQALDRALVAGPEPQRLLVRQEPEVKKNKSVAGTADYIRAKIKARRELGEDPSLSEAERDKLRATFPRFLEKYTKTIESAEHYLREPVTKTGFPLDCMGHGTFGHDRVWMGLPKPKRRNSDEAPVAKLGRPIGRYVARCRIALTSPPKDGKPIFVELARAGYSPTKEPYKDLLGVFQVTGTMDNPQTIEVPLENVGHLTDRVEIVLNELSNIERNPVPVKRTLQAARVAANPDGHHLPDCSRYSFVWVDWLEVEGPFIDQWPPKAWTETFFDGLPNEETDESRYAREIIRRFAWRAFRRQEADEDYVTTLHGIYKTHRRDGVDFVGAIKEALAVVLASPSFVYMIEGADATSESKKPLNNLELASRLSYFLWSQPPDEPLFAAASKGKLTDDDELRRQVERMLKDPKSKRFYNAFVSQWLDLAWLDMVAVNKLRFIGFKETLRSAMREEPIRFFEELVDDNLSLTNFIDSDFVMIDPVLADFYGFRDWPFQGFRKTALPQGSPRGGLLGQAAILTMGGTGERTSPVERGVFVYSHLLGRSVPPPPPNVPQLMIPEDQSQTIRKILAIHTSKAQCASCHRRMDPLGFALEHFDAIGRWRDTESTYDNDTKATSIQRPTGELSINATGVMPDGTRSFNGHQELKAHLLANVEPMAKGFIKSMLTYALGRRVGFSDRDLIDEMHTEWREENYGMRDLLHAVVRSKEFRTK